MPSPPTRDPPASVRSGEGGGVCLEPENPKLITSAAAATGAGSKPDAIEFLDDRVLLFTSVGRQERVFRYALRASTAGTFGVPPLEASSMYDPGFGARTAAATLEITP